MINIVKWIDWREGETNSAEEGRKYTQKWKKEKKIVHSRYIHADDNVRKTKLSTTAVSSLIDNINYSSQMSIELILNIPLQSYKYAVHILLSYSIFSGLAKNL